MGDILYLSDYMHSQHLSDIEHKEKLSSDDLKELQITWKEMGEYLQWRRSGAPKD